MDKEKIITAMEWCRENPCKGCPYEQNKDAEGRCSISDDTIVLLKEQDAEIELKDKLICELQKTIKSGTMMIGKKAEVVTYDENISIVRCKDCKWRGTNACFCKAMDDVQDNWFCSEGERKNKCCGNCDIYDHEDHECVYLQVKREEDSEACDNWEKHS